MHMNPFLSFNIPKSVRLFLLILCLSHPLFFPFMFSNPFPPFQALSSGYLSSLSLSFHLIGCSQGLSKRRSILTVTVGGPTPHVIHVSDEGFKPTSLHIDQEETVTWVWEACSLPHAVHQLE